MGLFYKTVDKELYLKDLNIYNFYHENNIFNC